MNNEWEKIKNYWRIEFNQLEIFCDDNDDIIIFPMSDNSIIIISYMYFRSPRLSFKISSSDIIQFIKFIDDIKKLGDKFDKKYTIYFLCNVRLNSVKEVSSLRTLPTCVKYYHVNYNSFYDTIKIELLKPIEIADYLESKAKPMSIYYDTLVITDDRFNNWDNWRNKGYEREWYEWNDLEVFKSDYLVMFHQLDETYIEEMEEGFFFIWKDLR